jgi:hypothetical protein
MVVNAAVVMEPGEGDRMDVDEVRLAVDDDGMEVDEPED